MTISQGKELEQVEILKYLGAIIAENGDCSKEIQARLGTARGAVRSIDSLWDDRSIHVKVKQRLLSTLVWTVALYGCETWTLKAVVKRRIQGLEMTAYQRLPRVSWTAHRTNASVLQEVQPQERPLTTVQRRKLRYFGHVIRARNLCTEILEGRLDGKRRRGRSRTDDVKDWPKRTEAECSHLATTIEILRPSALRGGETRKQANSEKSAQRYPSGSGALLTHLFQLFKCLKAFLATCPTVFAI